jgi:MFS family permease
MMISQLFSNLAFNMQHFVLIFIIYGLTRSNTAVSGLILSFIIPAVLFSVITGVHVDRWEKRKVLLFTNLIRGLLILPFLIQGLHVGFMYTLTFLIALATQFSLPASSAIVPLLVPRALIMSANSILYLGVYATMFLGYILAGPFLLFLGKTYTIIVLALLFLVSTFFTLPIKRQYHYRNSKSEESDISFFRELREILPFIKKTKKVVHAFAVLTIAQAIIFMFAVLGPGYVATILNVQIENLSLILIAPAALGMGVGSFFLGSIGKKVSFRWLSGIGFMLSGIIFLLFPIGGKITLYLPIIVVLSVVVGFAISLVFIPGNATIQVETTERLRGRIYGLLNALSGAVSFLPVVLAGGLADLFGVGTVVAGVGILMIFISIFFFIFA